ncbi:uncharacterized protein LOC106670849 [Cimex lectularius]|uniref:CPR type cuticle protein n=1 Tax=Cimex lectularius TaxID=79782 RepID=A0A8I6SBX0_CIMLE|nr:uncharacterized protein LOC106670849 [Cimex lectularius]
MKLFIVLCLVAAAVAEAPNDQRSFYFVVSPKPTEMSDLAKVTEEVMARLKAQQGSDSGEYHVYLPDGRLQKVQYTTAPLKQADEQQAKPFAPAPLPAKLQAFQPTYFVKQVAPMTEAYKMEEKPTNFVASVKYTDVKPLSGPVYAYNPEPLVRLVRYAPVYQ